MEGLDLDVLRPATFARLSQVLRAAKAAGRPYHVVHFDGHGDYLDLAAGGEDTDENSGSPDASGGAELSILRYGGSVAGPVRPGKHGYLLFEAPAGAANARGELGGTQNTQLVDGPTLGRLLTETGVPVLVLNACLSAYAEARARPGNAETSAAEDVHARIRAYGSLAAEVADAGVPGVVAMRYNVYVVTAAQFMADLYAQLLAGRPLGEAATAARRPSSGSRPAGPGPTGCRVRPTPGSSGGTRRCWRWTGRSTSSGWCCCMRSPGRGSHRRRPSSRGGTRPPGDSTIQSIRGGGWARRCGRRLSVT